MTFYYKSPLICALLLQLLREIPPDGDKFAAMVEVSHALGIPVWLNEAFVYALTACQVFCSLYTGPTINVHYLWQHILNTEENWNAWKNEGCPSFVKERYSSVMFWSSRSR